VPQNCYSRSDDSGRIVGKPEVIRAGHAWGNLLNWRNIAITLIMALRTALECNGLLTTTEKPESHIAVGGCFVAARRTYSMLMISQTIAIAA